jgi:imidazole glycerol-phosphate synthase subunit HisH
MTSPLRIALVDLGMGNLRSVEHCLRVALGDTTVVITNDHGAVRECNAVVFPGQGAFGDCATALQRDGASMARVLRDHIENNVRFLGICLGLQVLFETSEEAPGHTGLGVFRGHVKRFRDGLHNHNGDPLKVPHMGWNTVRPTTTVTPQWIRESQWFYFVHSYHVVPEDQTLVAAVSDHGDDFVCAVSRGNLLGVQFHPEKSHAAGITLLQRFFLRGHE